MQLAVLELLRDYRYLPTPYIKHALGSPEYIEDILPELANKHYIGIPEKARNRCKTKAVPYVYELWPRGLAFLAKHERNTDRAVAGNWFEHDFLAECVRFSFDRGPIEVPGLRKRDAQSILRHENCPPQTRNSPTPFVIPTYPPLKADAEPFGFEYDGKLVFFHGFEADNGTETISTTIKSKIERYSLYLDDGGPTRLFGMLKSHMHILFVTISEARLQHMLDYVPEHLADRFYFKATTGFNQKFPPPTAHMVLDPWTQKGGKTWSILQHLGAENGRIQESRESERVGA